MTKAAAEREQLARRNQEELAKEAEQRLVIDTVAKVLQLITHEQGYAPQARVAGAIATLMQLRGGTVAVRILGALWKDDAVDVDTAVWLIEQILQQPPEQRSDEEVDAALFVLHQNASKLVPAPDDPDQYWYYWPEPVSGIWMVDLSHHSKAALISASVTVLLSRNRTFWRNNSGHAPITDMLVAALDDNDFAPDAARVLLALVEAEASLVFSIDDVLEVRVRELSMPMTPIFERKLASFASWLEEANLD